MIRINGVPEKVERIKKHSEKTGNLYTRIIVTIKGVVYAGFGSHWNKDWEAGSNVEFNYVVDGKYNNIVPPTNTQKLNTSKPVENDFNTEVELQNIIYKIDELNKKIDDIIEFNKQYSKRMPI